MLTAVVFVPTPPLIVPELAGGATRATADLRDACLQAVSVLAEVSECWTAIAADTTDQRLPPRTAGTWRSFGADVSVALAPHVRLRSPGRTELPLPALVAGWLRERIAPDTTIDLQLYAEDTPQQRCGELGRALAADPRTEALLVLGDGCTTLSEKAPGAFDERAGGLQSQIDQALADADTQALGGLEPRLCAELGVSGRVPWQIAASAGGNWRGRSLYTDAPYGVGYQVAVWHR